MLFENLCAKLLILIFLAYGVSIINSIDVQRLKVNEFEQVSTAIVNISKELHESISGFKVSKDEQ